MNTAHQTTSPEPEQYIGRLLQQAFRDFNRQIVLSMRAAGYNDLTPSQAELMSHIPTQGISIIEIAQKLGITKQATGGMVKQLGKRGYVRKSVDPRDARSVLVQFDKRGQQFVHDAHAVKLVVEAEYIAKLGKQRFRVFKDCLEKILLTK